MLLEYFDFVENIRLLHVFAGLFIGLGFGVAAQITRFCLRRSVVGEVTERMNAGVIWLMALFSAVAGFFVAAQFGLVDLEGHRYLTQELPILALLLGGALFGAGMVLTRGCISRLTVLGATGNMRAVMVLIVFAIVAHATLKGVLAPFRVAIGSFTVPSPIATLYDAPILAAIFGLVLLAAIMRLIVNARPALMHLALGVLIGLTPVLGWMATSTLLFDEFDPLPVQSMAFTLPWSDTLFWTIASSAIPAGFGTGMIGGVMAGAFLSALMRGETRLVSFESGHQTLRYGLGASLMGVGGVLAGGCTVGAGLSGSASMSISALIALGAIVAGAIATDRLISRQPNLVPAE